MREFKESDKYSSNYKKQNPIISAEKEKYQKHPKSNNFINTYHNSKRYNNAY